jgi:hypothetical protein
VCECVVFVCVVCECECGVCVLCESVCVCEFLAAIFNLETDLGARTSGSSFRVITGCAVPNVMSICQSHRCGGLCSA